MAKLIDSTARTSVAVRQAAQMMAVTIRSLIRQLTLLDQEIADLDDATTGHFSYFGRCPVDSRSGHDKDPHPRLSQAGNRYVRRIIWMLAIHVIRRRGLLVTIYAILKSGAPMIPPSASAMLPR